MNTDDRIILYFDNQMSEEEKLGFKKEISESPELKKQVENYISFLRKLDESQNIDFDEDYFATVIPNFRKNFQPKTKKNFFSKVVYGLTTIAVIIISIVFIFNSKNTDNSLSLKSVISNMDSTELNNAINDYSAGFLTSDLAENVSDSTLNLIVADELDITRESAENILLSENIDFNKIYQTITNEEAEILYNKLLNKKY